MVAPISNLRGSLIAYLVTQEDFLKEFMSLYKKSANADVIKRIAEVCYKKFPFFAIDARFCEDLSTAITKKANRACRISQIRSKRLIISDTSSGGSAPTPFSKPGFLRTRSG